MSKRRRPKPRKNNAPKPPPSLVLQATVSVPRLEVVRGYDGLFRGEPEPLVLYAVFAAGRLLAREQVAFTVATDASRTLRPDGLRDTKVRVPRTAQALTVAFVAIEHDSGSAADSMYAAFDRPLRAWRPSDSVPQPLELDDPQWLGGGDLPQAVELQLDGAEWRQALAGDDLISAALVVVPTERGHHELRVPFLGPDGKNEWTALASLVLA